MRGRHWGKRLFGVFALGICVVLLMNPSPVRAQGCWTTIGSVGEVDEADKTLYFLDGMVVGIRSVYTEGDVVLRYNIVDEEGLHGGVPQNLAIRYQDNGTAAQVRVQLYRVSVSSGLQTTLINFSSNSYAALAGFQTRLISTTALPPFDFLNYAYYFRVTLSRTSSAGQAALSLIRLCK